MAGIHLARFTLTTLFAAALAGLLLAGEAGLPISPERAEEVALKQTGGGEVVEMERKRGDGVMPYYRFEIVKGDNRYSVEVDATDGGLNKFIRKQSGGKDAAQAAAAVRATPASRPVGTPLTLEQAEAAALRLTDGGSVTESDTEGRKSGRVVYEFEIVNRGVKYDLKIAATDGEVLEFKENGRRRPVPGEAATERRTVASGSRNATPARLNQAEAKALALEEVGGGEVIGYEIDHDDGRLVHEIKIQDGTRRYEVDIDDATGKVREMSTKR